MGDPSRVSHERARNPRGASPPTVEPARQTEQSQRTTLISGPMDGWPRATSSMWNNADQGSRGKGAECSTGLGSGRDRSSPDQIVCTPHCSMRCAGQASPLHSDRAIVHPLRFIRAALFFCVALPAVYMPECPVTKYISNRYLN